MKSLMSSLKRSNEDTKSLRQAHWTEKSSYPEWWIERSLLLLGLLQKSPFAQEVHSFSEYGCGPNRPFATTLMAGKNDALCHSLDLQAWDQTTLAVDLNVVKAGVLPQSDCGVLSGVLEYLNHPDEVLSELVKAHQFLLFSYCFAPTGTPKNINEKVQLIGQRAAKGWRNHMSIEELLTCISNFGYICEIKSWRDQVLVFAVRFDQN